MLDQIRSKDLFIYPYPVDEKEHHELFLLYSPMLRKAVWLDREATERIKSSSQREDALQRVVDQLSDFIPLKERTNKVREVKDYPLLTVLPNQKCNLSCSYCYSANGRSSMELDSRTLKTAIDFFIDSKEESKPLSISYMGGGEPMLSWPLVMQSILYARDKASSQNKKIDFTIISNGTLMTDEMLDFIKENQINISISFEIIEEIQNKQRGKYPLVVETIRTLVAHDIIPQINSTITPDNVKRMLEMYHLLEEQFPQIRNMMFEPVTASGLFDRPEDLTGFLKIYTENFLIIDKDARAKGKSLTSFPYLRTVFPTERACAGEFCLTPDGKLSGCYCITSPTDVAYEKSIYGEIASSDQDHKVEVDKALFEELLNNNVYSKEKCNDCCVKWNCGGGCFHLFNSYPPAYQDVFCEFTKEFVQRIILQRYERLYENRFGVSPLDDREAIKANHTLLSVK